jgi:Domain of unknown function (DUF4253)
MPANPLPGDGTLRIGQVSLPAGRRIAAGRGSLGSVAWVTDGPVEDPGPVWSALSRQSAVTGLVPFLAAILEDEGTRAQVAESLALSDGAGFGHDYEDDDEEDYDDEDYEDDDGGPFGERGRPWDNGEFGHPEDITGLGDIDSAGIQAASWQDQAPSEEDMAEDDEWRQMIAPFSPQFPGLAPACHQALPADEIERALQQLHPARIGLAAADRPADVLPLIGWTGNANWGTGALPVASVLRSWEDRFGARLLRIGFAQISLLATRPPRDLRSAQLLAAEHFAFCNECGGLGLTDVSSITRYLMASPVWTFWWD